VSAHVSGLLVTPVKALRILRRDAVTLERGGVVENRRFFIVDGEDRMVNGNRFTTLQAIVADYSHEARQLSLTFPDGRVVAGAIGRGQLFPARFSATTVPAIQIAGPWSAALSEYAGAPVRLVESGLRCGAVDRGGEGTISLISRATVDRVAAAAGVAGALDERRFRMLLEIDGVDAHAEDDWIDHRVRVGEAVITLRGHVGRCAITTRDPDTGKRDVDALGALATYRRKLDTTEPLACGVYGEVDEPGTVRVGDGVRAL
jgi:uncharacterized protein